MHLVVGFFFGSTLSITQSLVLSTYSGSYLAFLFDLVFPFCCFMLNKSCYTPGTQREKANGRGRHTTLIKHRAIWKRII